MIKMTDTGEPASELERLIADLSESGQLIFVFGVGWWTGHLTGAATPVFRGPAGQRWWHVELGDGAASWIMDVRVDEITGVRFVREPYPFPSFPWAGGPDSAVPGADVDTVLSCYVHELYDGRGCARRSWRPGWHCANATATATSHESIKAPSWPRQPEPSDPIPVDLQAQITTIGASRSRNARAGLPRIAPARAQLLTSQSVIPVTVRPGRSRARRTVHPAGGLWAAPATKAATI